jgi:hypothetical protein
MIEQQSISRRSFLTGAGIVTGAAVVAAGTGLINPKSAEASYSALPWKYAPNPGLAGADMDLVKRRGYDFYASAGGCMAGTGKALVVTIMEKLTGADYDAWDSFPQDMFTYGGGGVSAWGTICGSLHGAAYVLAACAPNGTVATNLINDLFQWYCGFNFPSADHDSYGLYPNQTRTVCNSPLCHASVSTWCKATGIKVSAPERGKRCAKVAGDCAGKAAELLNSYFYGTYATTFVQPDTSCSSCHVTAGTEKWVQGKATCNTCHGTGKNTVKPSGSTCTRP